MKIILNGKEKKLKAVNLEKILASLRFNPEKLIVSVNGDLVEKADYAKTTLSEGDNLEVFSFVGGG
jgi:thiamine biosynthesis protein ThiS